MGNVFGSKKTLKEIIREQKRALDRSIRSLDRERNGLKRTESKLINDIKKAAAKNEMKSVKIMARDLVRIRAHQTKFVNLSSQLRAISLQMTSMASQQQLQTSMRQATRSMMAMNRVMKLPALQKTMMEFQKQSEMMEMKQEMVQDAVEDALDDEEAEEESEQVVQQVLDEIGINLNSALVSAPNKVKAQEQKVANPDRALEDRLASLKGGN
jgi:charged multivesicular body protein 2A